MCPVAGGRIWWLSEILERASFMPNNARTFATSHHGPSFVQFFSPSQLELGLVVISYSSKPIER
jgi:hypothetical protein